MAAGDPFSLVPNEVVTIEPEYNNAVSQSESMKKEYFNISDNAIERFRLTFKFLTTNDRDVLLNHVKDQHGGYHSFSWQSVPNYVGGGSNMTGRWVEGSLSMTPISNRWRCVVGFEKEVA